MNYLTTWTPPDPSSPAPASVAAGGSDAPIQHPGWCEAYDGLMIELVAGLTAGPAFLALLGSAGTGKTWMLQTAAAALRRRGQPAILVRRGELPIEVFPGTAVLVDEAARMDDQQLARLAAVRDASIVLADLPAFAARLDQLARPPAIVPLAPLAPEHMPEFAAAWLGARGLPAGMLTHPAVARLFDHSAGVPRLVVQLLRAALAMQGELGAAGIGPDAVNEMAALRLGGFDAGTAPPAVQDAPHPSQGQPGVAQDAPGMAGEEPAAADPAPLSEARPSPPPPKPTLAAPTPTAPPSGVSVQPRRRVRRAARAAVLPALAASLLMAAALAVRHMQQAPSNRDTVLAASGAAPSAASVPHDAEIPAAGSMPGAQPPPVRAPDAPPDAAPAAPVAIQAQPVAAPSIPPSPSPSPAPSPAPTIEAVPAPAQEAAVAASPGQAADPAPNPSEPAPPEVPAQAAIPPMPDEGSRAAVPAIPVMPPLAAPSPPEPAPAPPSEAPEPQSLAQASGAPGLVLVAHAGDTMPALYAKVYRGVRPPPYPDVVAANHVPLRPGAIVVFPAPQDGWLGR